MEKQGRISLLFRGIATDVTPKHLSEHARALDVSNMSVSADGRALRAPVGGRTQTHDCSNAISSDSGMQTVCKLSPKQMGKADGLIIAGFASDNKSLFLKEFSPGDKYRAPGPLPDVQPPAFSVTSPWKGDLWFGNEDQTVSWSTIGTAPAGTTNLKIELWYKNAGVWELSKEITASVARSAGSYSGANLNPLANTYTAGTYKIRVEATENETWYAESGEFSIFLSAITFVAPVDATVIQESMGSYWIQWQNVGTTGATVTVQLHRTATGQIGANLATGVANDGYCEWTVGALGAPFIAATDYFIRVIPGGVDPLAQVDSDEFTVQATVPTPAVDSVSIRGSTAGGAGTHGYICGNSSGDYTIQWGTTGAVGTVSLEVVDLGPYTGSLRSATINDPVVHEIATGQMGGGSGGSYTTWVIPTTWDDGTTEWGRHGYDYHLYAIRVRSESDPNLYAHSSTIYIYNPWPSRATVGDDVGDITADSTVGIHWHIGSSDIANVKIELIDEDGTTNSTIVASTSNDGYYEWTVGTSLSGDGKRIRVSDVTDATVEDESATPFSISTPYHEYGAFAVWNRQENPNGALNGIPGGQHEIWRFDLANGPNDTPIELVSGKATYGGAHGTNYTTVREMITDKDGNLIVLWLDAEVLAGGAPPTYGLPGIRDGRTARVSKYEIETGEEPPISMLSTPPTTTRWSTGRLPVTTRGIFSSRFTATRTPAGRRTIHVTSGRFGFREQTARCLSSRTKRRVTRGFGLARRTTPGSVRCTGRAGRPTGISGSRVIARRRTPAGLFSPRRNSAGDSIGSGTAT
jgi:hypothetical protein